MSLPSNIPATESTDYFFEWKPRWVGKVGAGGVVSDVANEIPLQSAVGLTNGRAYVVTVNRVNPSGTTKNPVSDTETFVGELSGSNFINCIRGVEGQAQAWDADTVLEVLVTAYGHTRMLDGIKAVVDAIKAEHNDDGTHDNTKIVTMTGNQTIAGVKTFSSSPVVPAPTTDLQAATKKYVDDGLSNINAAYGGWLTDGLSGVTVTRHSTDNPTVVLRFDADVTDYIWKGMRIKVTENSIVHYFIVSADPVYSNPNTDVTCLSEIDTTTPTQAKNLLGAGTISDVSYAPPKTYPKGFPIEKNKWTVELNSSSSLSENSPSSGTWYNLTGLELSIPIGVWDVIYSATVGARGTVSSIDIVSTLSTTNNSETDKDWSKYNRTSGQSGDRRLYTSVFASKVLSLSAKDTYYLNVKTETGSVIGLFVNLGNSKTIIRAASTLL